MISANKIIMFTCGEYSDYSVTGIARAVVDFDIEQCGEVFKAEVGKGNFAEWLTGRGLIEEIEYIEAHTGDYGPFNLSVSVD